MCESCSHVAELYLRLLMSCRGPPETVTLINRIKSFVQIKNAVAAFEFAIHGDPR